MFPPSLPCAPGTAFSSTPCSLFRHLQNYDQGENFPPLQYFSLASNFNATISLLSPSLPPSLSPFLPSFLSISFPKETKQSHSPVFLLSLQPTFPKLPLPSLHLTQGFPYQCDKVQAGLVTHRRRLSGDCCNWRADAQSKADSCPQELGVQCCQIL